MGRLSADEHYELSATYFCAMTYYREKIIRTILNAGLTLHVFGDSWKEPAFSGYPNLIIHPLADAEDSLKLYAQSKVSLNIMSWHKDGMTERIANSMLNRAVVLSDPSTYLTEHYTDDREIVYYHLTRLDELPGKIRKLLADDDYRETIAENACKYAAVHDTWDNRAEEFLKIIDEINPAE
jgi:spore maturation protein CgeB